MFKKLAAHLLQELYDECLKKSLTIKNKEDSEIYNKISSKLESMLTQLKERNNV